MSNYHTPEEARKKWCPMVRRTVMSFHAPAVNKSPGAEESDPGPRSEDMCIADKCMMWRWSLWRDGRQTGQCGLAGS